MGCLNPNVLQMTLGMYMEVTLSQCVPLGHSAEALRILHVYVIFECCFKHIYVWKIFLTSQHCLIYYTCVMNTCKCIKTLLFVAVSVIHWRLECICLKTSVKNVWVFVGFSCNYLTLALNSINIDRLSSDMKPYIENAVLTHARWKVNITHIKTHW